MASFDQRNSPTWRIREILRRESKAHSAIAMLETFAVYVSQSDKDNIGQSSMREIYRVVNEKGPKL